MFNFINRKRDPIFFTSDIGRELEGANCPCPSYEYHDGMNVSSSGPPLLWVLVLGDYPHFFMHEEITP